MKLANVASSFKASVTKHSPEILMGFGIAGMLTSTVLAVKGTIKATKHMEKRNEEEKVKNENFKCFQWKQVVKETWKYYIPSAVTAGVSITCLVGSSKVSSKRNAVLATAYKIAESAHREYREKVIETIGEKKEELVREKIVKDKMEENPVNNNTIIMTGNGETLFFDAWSGRYFKSDIEKVKKAENLLNLNLRNENYISLNEFYDLIGLEHNELGYILGWSIDKGYVDINFTPEFTPETKPCIAIHFSNPPFYDYSKMY